MRKIKLNKSFQPMPCDEEDECYPNGIFVFNITKLIAFIQANQNEFPCEEIEIKTLNPYISDNLNESTIQSANCSIPIILAEISPGNFNVIDGHHRLAKAHRLDKHTILAYKLLAEQHIPFLTSTKAYQAYVDYWNIKLNEMEQ